MKSITNTLAEMWYSYTHTEQKLTQKEELGVLAAAGLAVFSVVGICELSTRVSDNTAPYNVIIFGATDTDSKQDLGFEAGVTLDCYEATMQSPVVVADVDLVTYDATSLVPIGGRRLLEMTLDAKGSSCREAIGHLLQETPQHASNLAEIVQQEVVMASAVDALGTIDAAHVLDGDIARAVNDGILVQTFIP